MIRKYSILLSILLVSFGASFSYASKKIKIAAIDISRPLSGVDGSIKGIIHAIPTTRGVGFSIWAGKKRLCILSFASFKSNAVTIASPNNIPIKLITNDLSAGPVGVLCNKKERQAFANAVPAVASDAREPCCAKALTTSLLCLHVRRSIHGPCGSPNILLCGLSSLNDGNHPLLVTDGAFWRFHW
ncbi:hypothetical protein [Pedobacter endophyticus]|uniref:Uncharacterized protein n=1 Tax=Pedobacter endophyticus TaxID=2789740 RepID=A0A7S9L2B5_9SPHI|nr:hypothetical protein [Pedobacter endophyticus]QPH41157.1 hypothetical protein IZT61_07830 [Pedobacter endophyticus]